MQKKVAVDAVNDTKPAAVVFGTVTDTNPLKIRIGDLSSKLEIPAENLILTNAVRDHQVRLSAVDGSKAYHVTETENQSLTHAAHNHTYVDTMPTGNSSPTNVNTGTATVAAHSAHDHNYTGGVFKVHLGLKLGEKVIMIQVQGGQSYLVLDRYEPPDGTEGSD